MNKLHLQLYNKSLNKQDRRNAQSRPKTIQIQQPFKIIDFIGRDRLLSSFDQLAPIPHQPVTPSKLQDRFIPNRKTLTNNYDRQQYPYKNQNHQQNDPQSISISSIYNTSILGTNPPQQQESLRLFVNSNILRYNQNQRLNQHKEIINPFGDMQGGYQKVRKISKIPCKVLDAPALQDDFYLNLIDWSSKNQLVVGLGNCVYLWNAQTSKVTKLCELYNDIVTSVSWDQQSKFLAIGCNRGSVQIWDVQQGLQLRRLSGHQTRVGTIAWNSNLLATGSRDKSIFLRDIRARRDYSHKLLQHTQEVCGLKWSNDHQYLASGGNDNKICVWSVGGQAINRFTDHHAAVKALAWSPQQHGLLASGGGTADRTLRLRNVFTGQILCEKDTGSQICNLAFSKNVHELVSTHGYSQNQINVWSYPKLRRIATLVGHSHRVLYLSMSPDGSTIVTGAGDQTLRFWNVFPTQTSYDKQQYIQSQTMQLR